MAAMAVSYAVVRVNLKQARAFAHTEDLRFSQVPAVIFVLFKWKAGELQRMVALVHDPDPNQNAAVLFVVKLCR